MFTRIIQSFQVSYNAVVEDDLLYLFFILILLCAFDAFFRSSKGFSICSCFRKIVRKVKKIYNSLYNTGRCYTNYILFYISIFYWNNSFLQQGYFWRLFLLCSCCIHRLRPADVSRVQRFRLMFLWRRHVKDTVMVERELASILRSLEQQMRS